MPTIEASFHADNPFGPAVLAVNVKVYDSFRKVETLWPWFYRIGYSRASFDQLMEDEFENQQRNFWENTVQDIGKQYHFDTVYSEGRSSGWAVPIITGMVLTEDNLPVAILTNYHNFKEAVKFVLDNLDQSMYSELRSVWQDEEWEFLNRFVSVRWINERKERVLVP
jgi:hypothetical protein